MPGGGRGRRGSGARRCRPPTSALFFGYLPLLLAAVGTWKQWARARFWLMAAVCFAVLALGPYLHVADHLTFGPGNVHLPLPYLVLQRIPGVNVSRVPVRFALVAVLCLAVLGGLGVLALIERPWAWFRGRAMVGLMALLAPLLVLEQIVVPVPLKAIDIPPFYQQLAASPEQGAILEWPLSLKRSRSLLYQTVHQRPLIGSYLSRPLVYPLLTLPPYREQYYPLPTSRAATRRRWAATPCGMPKYFGSSCCSTIRPCSAGHWRTSSPAMPTPPPSSATRG